ncbi:hypothetical protein LJE71_02155 [Xanthobacter autotrophicus]|uniref:hypothetical protein n=1 Tax=Xanthobacter autotrophicus TaxID=280 RepID=UPI001E45E8CD|nr:hypothetical protein [Xanthobacter autotrophicus]UDQ89853.1 hypothetical protein LJE71_02155 [Xanthobacter autotrophicus]
MADEKPLRPLEKWVPASDVISKIVIAAAIGLIGAYLTFRKNNSDLEVQCNSMVNNLLKIEGSKKINVDVISYQIKMIPKSCNVDRNDLFKQITSLIGQETSPLSSQPTTPLPDQTSLSGWAAIGVLGTGAFKDVNFDQADGKPIIAPPSKGSVLRARWQVYVRPGPADWSKVNGILRAGECFEVESYRLLKADTRDQIWVNGQRRDCPRP